MEDVAKQYKGFLFSSTIGIIAYFSAPLIPSMSQVLLGFLMGILIGNFVKMPVPLNAGISFTSSKMLEISILFLAFSINYTHIAALGWQSFGIIVVTVLLVIMATVYLAKIFHCPGSTGWLVGYGTAICGSSAVAALAPTVSKDKEDVGIAMAVVNLLGSIAMVSMPFVLSKFDLSNSLNGLLIGGSLHSVGNVAGAAFSMNNEIGENALTIKLARVALLSPTLILFNFFVSQKGLKDWKDHFKLPWYLWSFIGITLLTSIVQLPVWALDTLETLGKVVLTIAMTANGLTVSFKSLYRSGRRGIGFGIMVFIIQIVILVLLSSLLS